MDINDISKVANRKRINTDAEELRYKLSRETTKIIKLKLAQDTAYWDLKEKLRQVEGNHEKLQQNMVEVQMQHEAISGQYQEELRLRPDTLNKVSSTREICDVLEEYSARLKETLARCRADHAALGAAHRASGQLVRELRARQREDAEAARRNTAALEEKVKLLTEHQNQLLEVFSAVKQQAAAESTDLRAQLAVARAHEQELATAHAELSRTLDLCKHDVEKKEEMNSNLQADMKKMMQEFNKQATEATAIFADQEKQLKDLKEENMSLKKAVDNQDQFTKSICEQKNTLQEKIVALEDEHHAMLQTNDELKAKLEDASNLKDNLQNNVATLNDEKQNLLLKVQETQQIVNDLEKEIQNLEAKHTRLENEKSEVIAELSKAVEESKSRAVEVETLTSLTKDQQIELSALDTAFKAYRDAAEEKNKELNALIVAKDSELDSKACTITKLMSEVKKLEEALQRFKREIEIERDAVKEKEKKMSTTIAQLETCVRDKEDELSKQMSVILEMRDEKERLQEKIQGMQTKMDNVQKELTRPVVQPAVHMQPELDDNAVMLTPTHKTTQLQLPASPLKPAPAQFATPRALDPDDMVFNLFSESSTDADTLDTAVVNARFNALARGEYLSPMPLAALKRRGAPPAHRAAKHKPADKNNTPVSFASQPKTKLKNKERSFFKNKGRQQP